MKVSEMFELLEKIKEQERQNDFVLKKLRAVKKAREQKNLEETVTEQAPVETPEIKSPEKSPVEEQRLEDTVDQSLAQTFQQPYVQASADQEQTYKIFPSELTYTTQTQTNFSDLTNTFIKEGLLSEGQPVSPDQRGAIMNRLQTLMPGADPVKILSYVSGIAQGPGKKEGVERRKIE